MSVETETDNSILEPEAIQTPPAELDFARYRSHELVEELSELISVPGRIVRVVRTAALVIAFTALACYLIHEFAELSLIPSLIICAYSLFASVYFGVSLGVLRVISNALRNLEAILQIVLHTTVEVAQDYDRARTGQLQLPASDEFVELVYGKVVLPALEQAVGESFRFLSRPILWCYRRTIGSSVHKLVARVNRSLAASQEEPATVPETAEDSETVKSWFERVVTFTSTASRIAANLGRRLRTYAMLPLYFMYGVTVAIALIPVAAVIYFMGG